MKTNAVRILDSAKIKFKTFEYDFDENALDAVSVATKINAEPEQVFKTLVSKSDSAFFVFCIPGNFELNLKKAAIAANVKKIEMLPLKELTNVTGYVRGGCSPIGMKKLFPTFIDETALLFDNIYVSAGIRGMQLFINPNDLANIINAKFADLI
jgi:Cys-tRNA(Pro)/Cys-tRNA(Cys) deacylase